MDEQLLQFFDYAHLQPHLQVIVRPFAELANSMAGILPRNPERTTAIRRILEAKDCAVRAVLWRDTNEASDRLTTTGAASLATHLG